MPPVGAGASPMGAPPGGGRRTPPDPAGSVRRRRSGRARTRRVDGPRPAMSEVPQITPYGLPAAPIRCGDHG